MVFSSPVRRWLLPNVTLLAALALWGILRYPHLPSRIPQHIGIDRVDAWTDRSIGSAFVPVFVYLGATVLLTACAELTLRVTPQAELPKGTAPFGNGLVQSSLNRPRTRASALRIARALLALNACTGISLLIGSGVLWRSTTDPEVPGWLFAAMILPILIGTALTVAAAVRDRRTP
ncbi:hypothetical protein HEK616_79310 (plasmid) [Streptomyces nigrescens]|uniref:DUF1648 domain-containing protein n=2 Tax=Streptomyces TaxID=1883 RepID=A0ABM8A6T4_STRNI|nr:DUF1648 domain-containing protein [Streptomyces nigrescens]MEE4418850.1 DUF1648 domain-containing protein [Streptomyces sp. DSM 41528]BDM74444.1 hypothetical protein HEK616_79310 [Streptomyces nigrescens]